MKKFLLIMVAVCCLLSCKKSNPISSNLFGKWELDRRHGGNILPQDSVYKPGNGNIIQFNSDSTYKMYFAGTLSQQGIYHIRKNGFTANQKTYDVLYFDGETSLISLNGDMLTLTPLMPDIGTSEYKKLQN